MWTARKLLKTARKTNRQEWKVFLESVQLELRCQSMGRALKEARKALEVHRGTGRLWAVLIQLEHSHGVERQLEVFKQALLEVPKSGEVWCEGARICLNPFSACFNLQAARNFLDFAIEFTPQYGDSFIEYLRLQMLTNADAAQIERLWQLCINAEPNYGTLWFYCKSTPLLSTRQVSKCARARTCVYVRKYEHAAALDPAGDDRRGSASPIHACMPRLSTRQVLGAATSLIGNELDEWKHVYEGAARRAETPEFRAAAAEAAAAALESPGTVPPLSLADLSLDVQGGPPAEPIDFVTGSVGLNRMQRRCAELTSAEQRGLIFGGDMIVP